MDSNYFENEVNKCSGFYEIKFFVRWCFFEGGVYCKIGSDKDKFFFDLMVVFLFVFEILW